MTPEAQLRLLKSRPEIIKVSDAIKLLDSREKVIFKRQCESTDLKLQHELFMIDCREFNTILEELECMK